MVRSLQLVESRPGKVPAKVPDADVTGTGPCDGLPCAGEGEGEGSMLAVEHKKKKKKEGPVHVVFCKNRSGTEDGCQSAAEKWSRMRSEKVYPTQCDSDAPAAAFFWEYTCLCVACLAQEMHTTVKEAEEHIRRTAAGSGSKELRCEHFKYFQSHVRQTFTGHLNARDQRTYTLKTMRKLCFPLAQYISQKLEQKMCAWRLRNTGICQRSFRGQMTLASEHC